MPGVKVIGASSDHTLLDVEELFERGFDDDVKAPLKVGDVLEFAINYASMVFVTASRNVTITYK